MRKEQDDRRVALLSFHNGCNYGAALQAYGLLEAVESLGVEAQYIDYVNDVRARAYSPRYQIKSSLLRGDILRTTRMLVGSGLLVRRRRAFERFYAAHLKKTSRTYHSSNEVRELDGAFDFFVVGSDQVWNPTNNGGDSAYLLDFVSEPAKKALLCVKLWHELHSS